jgi:hypothetical protein
VQLTVQSTPALVVSPVTFAVMFCDAPASIEVGWLANAMEIEPAGVMVTGGVLADLVPSAMDVAVIVTVFPGGTVLGAVYTMGAPLKVLGGLRLNVPQLPPVQVTDQVTPLFVVSFVTVALSDV